jgi:branched-chain amino acid transport system permease protein
MTSVIQYLVTGLALGCTYGIVAIGFIVVYRVTRYVNFAQGTLVVLGALISASLVGLGWPFPLAVPVAAVVAAGVGVLFGWIVLAQRGISGTNALVLTVALGVGSYGVEVLIWGSLPQSYGGWHGQFAFGAVSVSRQYLLVIVTTVVAFVLVNALFNHTFVGKAMTACSENRRAARLVGIDPRRMGLIAFGLAGVLGGLAGGLIAPLQPISFDSDINLSIYAFGAAIFGSLRHPRLAFAGGMLLGVTQALVAGYINASYQSMISLAVIVVVIMVISRKSVAVEV